MSGDTTYQALERLTHMPSRSGNQGDRVAGQHYYDVLFTGGAISNVTLSNITGAVSSVSGTTNRITVSNGTTAAIVDISANYVGQNTITTLGTVATGTWNAGVISGQYGGTGVANTGKTITLGGNLVTSGAFNTTLTVTADTSITFPTTGTLATRAGVEALTNKSVNGVTLTTGGSATQYLNAAGNYVSIASGTVTSVSVATANGFAGSVATSTTTPAITLSTTITGILKGSGTAISAASAGTDYLSVLTGDITTSGNAATLATVNSNVGSFTHSSITVNAKGLITAASSGAAPVFSTSYTSAQTSYTAGSTITLAHGLGSVPKQVYIYGVCTTTQSPFTSGQVFQLMGFNNGANNPLSAFSRADATSIFVDVSGNGLQYNATNLTAANFRIVAFGLL